MNFTKKIIRVIEDAETNKAILNLEETISVMNAFKNVSENKSLIEKTLFLLVSVDTRLENISKLSSRETQVFKLVGFGFSSKEISSLLAISNETVSTHRRNIIKKLNLKGSGKLQKAAFQYTQENLEPKKNTL